MIMTMADAPGQYGASNCPMVKPLLEALVVIYQAMRTALHRRIFMVIEMASKPSVFFSLSTRIFNNM